MRNRVAFVALSAMLAWAIQSSVEAQTAVTAGVYTADQATRGEKVYADSCAICHGKDLAAKDPIPSLTGEKFLANWSTVGDLYEKISIAMPANDPGSLTAAQTVDVLAHILRSNKFPAGSTELEPKAESLRAITIGPAK